MTDAVTIAVMMHKNNDVTAEIAVFLKPCVLVMKSVLRET